MKAGICGIGGKMGKTILGVLLEKGHSIGAAFEQDAYPFIGEDAGKIAVGNDLGIKISRLDKAALKNADGIIDFSNPKATLSLLEMLIEIKKPIVIGTTGFSDDEKQKIREAAKHIPVLFSPNMSLGVNLLFKLTEIAAKALGNDFDAEVFEAHHRFKVDSPSGTAAKLLEVIRDSMPGLNGAPFIYDRTDKREMRSNNEIGVQVMRGGDIVGEHTVFFAGIGERIELTHRASSRETFARGAVTALEFLLPKTAGLYDMSDVLGL